VTARNIFACLVHESPECVIDLVRNLHYLDPASLILLYNGGQDRLLLDRGFPFERHGAVVHPNSRPLRWGWLHDFALDSMRFALDHFPFETMTIVDSDQLAVRPRYSHYLAQSLAGRHNLGLLSNSPRPQAPDRTSGPTVAALEEIELWRPLLRRFPHGEEKFVFWSFWPATVFTADAARDLTRFFATDAQLQHIMARTRIWASEEVILPTLVALLGYRIAENPCSYRFVKYRQAHTPREVDEAMTTPDVFWMHPVARSLEDPVRRHIRDRFNQYQQEQPSESVALRMRPRSDLVQTLPILRQMKRIDGWLAEDEAELLMAATARALRRPHPVVEVGSYCGRSTLVLGKVVQAVRPDARVYAIDPHGGTVGALGQRVDQGPSTLDRFRRTIDEGGIADVVVPIRQYSFEVNWEGPIGLLLIDALHDYTNVARDFRHFERWVVDGGYIAFHDYADYYPGVKALVDEVLASGRYRKVQLAGSMMLVEKVASLSPSQASQPPVQTAAARQPSSSAHAPDTVSVHQWPPVSCITLTRDRRSLLPETIRSFQRQDYPNRELLVVDDGDDAVADLIPSDPRIRYIRLEGKRTVGAKRNLACREARGEIVVHWDDDDWMAGRRLRYQVGRLLGEGADVCGLATLLFYDAATDRAWQYEYPAWARPWVYGGTLCYTRAFWVRNPFDDVNVGEDARFVWSDRPKQILALEDHTFYVAMVHPGNTSPKRTGDPWWHPYGAQSIRAIMGDNWEVYARLFAGGVETR